MQVVKIYGVQDRRTTTQAKLPWVVRYTIDGRHRSKSFRTRIEADRYRGRLLQAVQDGSRFDESSGEPDTWQTPLGDLGVHEWARRWLAEHWAEWQPRTRTSATEALARFVTIAIRAGAKPPDGLRVYLYTALAPGADTNLDVVLERWLAKNCLTLGELDRDRVADIDRKLALKMDGSQMAANTANRIRIVARACIQSAIAAGAVAADVWPQRSKSRARRKVARTKRSVDIRTLPSPAVMAAAIDAIVTQQPGSKTYRVMTAVAYYAGLRPSEVVMLRVCSVDLPGQGWGRVDVTEADISFDEPGEPKTGPRTVPIPPVLVNILREWINENELTTPDRLLFRTRNDTMPSGSNWARAWHRALESIGGPPLRIYDCRHAAATTWLRAGMPLAETARRLGHSVETLVSTYVGALDDEQHIANQRMDTYLGATSPTVTLDAADGSYVTK
ncbi:MAG: site-specific integrase [Ilumatobacteraceae bacterium]